ncbi:MAG: ABC transporter permease [Oligoflexales bacterium]|nr:ABC transporter permease [Oligoflexales bacterium]
MMFLSLRQLLSRKKQSALILLGIVIGTAAYVAISGMMLGFQEKLMDQLVNNDAHVRISAREDILTAEELDSFNTVSHVFWQIPPSGRKDSAKIDYPIGWFNHLNQDVDVIAYAPQVNLNVIFSRAKVSLAGRMIGSNPFKQIRVTNIQDYMLAGKFLDIGHSGNRIVIGNELMQRLGSRLSETILISSGKSTPVPFKVVGIFETGIKQIDQSTVFSALADAQNLRGTPSELTDIAVKVSKPFDIQDKVEQWRLGARDKITSWQEASASILSVFKTQDIVRNSMTISIIVVAGFGIYNILSILVTQKRRDIAILRSMGFTPKDVMLIFFNQGLILGTLGGIVGLILGYLLCVFIGTIEIEAGRATSSSNHMIVSYDYLIYIKGWVIAMLSSIASALWPSRHAAKLEPMDIIREGG